MPARIRKLVLSEAWKEKIKTSQIMNRLMMHVDGEIELASTQVKAAQILLSKVVPDLARTEHSGPDGKDLIPDKITVELIQPKK